MKNYYYYPYFSNLYWGVVNEGGMWKEKGRKESTSPVTLNTHVGKQLILRDVIFGKKEATQKSWKKQAEKSMQGKKT